MFNVTTKITDGRVASLLCDALEGGANYWISDVSQGVAPTGKLSTEDYFHWSQWWPICGGSVEIVECDPDTGETKKHTLDRSTIEKGLTSMAEKSPKHLADFVSENDDGETGDVFLQHCLFGEIVYG